MLNLRIGWFSILLFGMAAVAAGHGPAHIGREAGQAAVNQALDLQETATPAGAAVSGRPWGASLDTGWESRHIHYGVNETGASGLYVNELGLQASGFDFGVWNGFGLGHDFVEWDFTAAYNIDLGPVFLVPGYNFRYVPGQEKHGADSGEEEHSEEEHEEAEHAGHEDEPAGHSQHMHQMTGHELFLTLGSTKLPYVTPSANFIWDLSNTPGAFLEFRVDGEVPVYRDVVSLQPYALLGLNFGYNTRDYYGWNNVQFGVQTTCRLCERISVFAGVNYSVALEALQRIDQGNEVWVNTGLSIAF